MAVQGEAEGDVYATVRALVLAHSLRDAGTSKKLAVLVTLDTVSAETIYDHVIPVSRIRNSNPANLHLMNRADLHSAFTKINLWKQTQFRKIVYIDSDVVTYRAPDELFDIPHPFSAAPDIGWPDLFNSGVMVLTPNMGDYYAMLAMAERDISFDGADQGLINMHFKNHYNRISFTYNVTPSGHYQYVPAYRHFQSGISMVHFIGPDKPWFKGRSSSVGGSPYDEMTGQWWAVYDRHYRVPVSSQSVPQLVQYFTKGEYQPKATYVQTTGELPGAESRTHHQHQHAFSDSHSDDHEYHEQFQSHDAPPGPQEYRHLEQHYDHQHGHVQAHPGASASQLGSSTSSLASSSTHTNVDGTHAEAREGQIHKSHHGAPPPREEQEQKPPPFQPSMSDWDAQRQPPPSDSKPEAINFPATVYEMSHDSTPFVPPQRYPSPPKDMWYEVPKDPPAPPSEPPKPIFPWETERPPPSRVFPDEQPQEVQLDLGGSETPTNMPPWSATAPELPAESSVTGSSTTEQKSEPPTPTTPTIQITPSDPWTSFTRTNAWDEVPEIERYVDKIQQKHQRKRSLKSPGVIALPGYDEDVDNVAWRRQGSKLTDFPSEAERPSLPVTPAPIRRAKFWGGDPGIGHGDGHQLLPAAEGVPTQTEWVCVHGNLWSPADCLCDLTNVLRYHKDPVAQLQKLARQQSEALLRKLGSRGRDSSDMPSRPLPFGSEELISPTYVLHSAKVLSPQPVKGSASPSAVRSIEHNLETTPGTSSTPSAAVMTIPEPSYAGPGAAFEKGENIPSEDVPTLRASMVPPPATTKAPAIPEPSYTGPGPAFEKDANILPEETLAER
ncbi:glycosyltransferase family 8 protein [Hypoxylon sp. NC1633]|nr:glycosyltransferase family 8 protein [Hypoxylon sp. NC1633]